MNLVLGEVLHADLIEFKRDATPLTLGATHDSLHENVIAVMKEIGIELIESGNAVRMRIYEGTVLKHVQFRLMSDAWLRNLR